jgi:hypothetical protein
MAIGKSLEGSTIYWVGENHDEHYYYIHEVLPGGFVLMSQLVENEEGTEFLRHQAAELGSLAEINKNYTQVYTTEREAWKYAFKAGSEAE